MSRRALSICLILWVSLGHCLSGQERFGAGASMTDWSPAHISRLPATQTSSSQADATAIATVPELSEPGLASLMRPSFTASAEWQSEVNGVTLGFYDAKVQVPTYPVFGPPPPMINIGFSYADLQAPIPLDLPTDLYDYSLGFSWTRPINDRWLLQSMFSTAVATDGRNQSSDAWQFRGGLFAIYRPNERWTWSYLAAGFEGGTWAIERSGVIDDRLTYRDWRIVLGWESTPAPDPRSKMPFTRGRKLTAEVGYVFAREFEFESQTPDIGLDNAWMLRTSVHF